MQEFRPKKPEERKLCYLSYDFGRPRDPIYFATSDSEYFPEVPEEYSLEDDGVCVVREANDTQYYAYIYGYAEQAESCLACLIDTVLEELDDIEAEISSCAHTVLTRTFK